MNIQKDSVIILPWISGGIMNERFTPFQQKAIWKGYDFIRFNAWEDIDHLRDQSYWEIHQEFQNTLDRVKGKVHIIGKSFWWWITLKQRHPKIKSMVLLAPAIWIWEEWQDYFRGVPNFQKQVTDLNILQTSKKSLQELNLPVHIIHGTNDQTIPLQNSKDLLKQLGKWSLYELDWWDHSFRDKNHEQELIEEAFRFIREGTTTT